MLYRVKSIMMTDIPEEFNFEANSPVACIEEILKAKGYMAKSIEKVDAFSFSNVIVKSMGKKEFISHYWVSGIMELKSAKLKEYEISFSDYGISRVNGKEKKEYGVTGFKNRLEKLHIKDGRVYLNNMQDFYKVFNKALIDDLLSCGIDKQFVKELKKKYLDNIECMATNHYYDDISHYYELFANEWVDKFARNSKLYLPRAFANNGFFSAMLPVLGDNFYPCYISIDIREV